MEHATTTKERVEMYCNVCDRMSPYRKCKWPRDELVCRLCGSIVRQRALWYIVNAFFPGVPSTLKIHQSSPGDTYFDRLLTSREHYSYSHYFPGVKSGDKRDGVLCADLTNLPFEDNSFDIFLTLDVFEHIFDPVQALREIHRVLRPGGYYFMTVPIENPGGMTQKACFMDDAGELVHLPTSTSRRKKVKLEYHGNPVDQNGSVVTYYYGKDLAHIIEKSGPFAVQVFFQMNDLSQIGIEGELKDVFACQKIGIA